MVKKIRTGNIACFKLNGQSAFTIKPNINLVCAVRIPQTHWTDILSDASFCVKSNLDNVNSPDVKKEKKCLNQHPEQRKLTTAGGRSPTSITDIGFPGEEEGSSAKNGEPQTYYLANFSQKMYENENILMEKGAVCPCHPRIRHCSSISFWHCGRNLT